MKKFVSNFLKVFLPLALGFFILYLVYKSLSEEDKKNIIISFKDANYKWIFLSLFLALFSHISRAYRWNYTIEALGFKTKTLNNFFSVMTGYFANLAFPRIGEVLRCAILSKYEKIPVNKLLGTILVERLIDLIILFLLTIIAIIIQIPVLKGFLFKVYVPLANKFSFTKIIFLLLIIIVIFVVSFYIIKKSNKLKELIKGIITGFMTLKTMKKKYLFFIHTAIIWMLYFVMFKVTFYSLPETENVPLPGVLAAFVFASYGILAIQGGFGAYPAIIMEVLMIYGVEKAYGFAFGWIVWTAQTLMIVFLGLLSMTFINVYNQNSRSFYPNNM